MKVKPDSLWERLELGLDRTAFGLLLGTTAFAPLALGSTYAWSASVLRIMVAAAIVVWSMRSLAGFVARRSSTLVDGERIERVEPSKREQSLRRWGNIRLGALALYLLLALVSTLANGWHWDAVQEFQRILSYAAGFALATTLIHTESRQRAFLATFAVASIVLATYGLLQAAGLGVTPSLSTARVSSLYFNPNHYAGFLDLATPLMFSLTLCARVWWVRLLSATVTMILAANVVLSYSRGAWVSVSLAVVAAIVTWLIVGSRTGKLARQLGVVTVWMVAVLGGALAVDTLAPATTAPIRARFLALTDDLSNLAQFERIVIVRASVPLLLDAPLLGTGPGGFIYAFPSVRPASLDVPEEALLHRFVNYAHNDYLQVGVETGFPALLAFLVFWCTALLGPTRRGTAAAFGMRFGILALLIHGLVDGNLTVIPSNAFLAYVMAGALHADSTEAGTDEASS